MAFDFRALRYFVAVAEELHFTRAAERLYISQPTLSEQIRRLESELGVQLFRRTTRNVELSAAGEDFLPRARRILAEADEAREAAARAARGETGRLRVGTGATAGLDQIPRVLRLFREERPQVHLELRQIEWSDYGGGLRDGTTDASFVWMPFELDGLNATELYSEPRVAALHADHPLAAEKELRIDQIIDEPWPWVDTDPVALAFWTCAEFRGDTEVRRGPTIRSMEGLLEAVRAALCIATVPQSQAEVSTLSGIVFRPVVDLTPATLALAWRQADDDDPSVGALVEIARRVASGDL